MKNISPKLLAAVAAGTFMIFSATAANARDHVNFSLNVGVPVAAYPVYAQPTYVQPRYVPAPPVYYQPQPVYVQPAPVYYPSYSTYNAPVNTVETVSYGYVNPPGYYHRDHWRHYEHDSREYRDRPNYWRGR